RQSGRYLQSVQVLGKATVSDLLEPEYSLDDADAVLDLRAHAGLAAVHRPDVLIDPAAPAVTLVGEVPGALGNLADRLFLASVGLIAPDPRLLAVQQVGQRVPVGHVGRRSQDGVDQLGLAVHRHVGLHAEVPLVALLGLVHLRVALPALVLGGTGR